MDENHKRELIGIPIPGWPKLVRKLVDDLTKAGWDGELVQIKEKFGGLRFYIGEGTDEMFNLIGNAERESLKLCEACEKPATGKSVHGWWRTRCDDCS